MHRSFPASVSFLSLSSFPPQDPGEQVLIKRPVQCFFVNSQLARTWTDKLHSIESLFFSLSTIVHCDSESVQLMLTKEKKRRLLTSKYLSHAEQIVTWREVSSLGPGLEAQRTPSSSHHFTEPSHA